MQNNTLQCTSKEQSSISTGMIFCSFKMKLNFRTESILAILFTPQITPSHSLLACRRFRRRNRIFCEGWRRIRRGGLGVHGPLFNVFTRKYRLFYCTFIWLGNLVLPFVSVRFIVGLIKILYRIVTQIFRNFDLKYTKTYKAFTFFCLHS